MRLTTFKRRAPAARRGAILAAAQAMLRRKDYHDITMDEVAQRAGVAKGTLYLYFPAKEGLFGVLAQQMAGQVAGRWDAIWEETDPGVERVKRLIEDQLEFFERNKNFFIQLFQGTLPFFCKGSENERARMIQANVHILRKAIQEGIQAGVFRQTDPQAAAICLFGLIRGFVISHIIGHLPGSLPRKADIIWDCFHRGMKP